MDMFLIVPGHPRRSVHSTQRLAHGLIVLSTEAVKNQKMNWSSAHALVLSMTTNLKSLVIKNWGWLGNEVGYLCMCRNSEDVPILDGSLGE